MFECFTEGAIKVIMLAQEEARRYGHCFVGTEQLLLGILGQRHGIGARSLAELRINIRKTRKAIENYAGRGNGFATAEVPFTPRAKRVLEMSVDEGKDLGQNFVGTEHILLALLSEKQGIAMRTLNKLDIDIRKLRDIIFIKIAETQEKIIEPLTKGEKFLEDREKQREKIGSKTPTLDEFSENISRQASKGLLDPVIGRESEINDLIASLSRRTKNNPVLIGQPGVGKTAVAEGLAQVILQDGAVDFLDKCVVIALDLGSVLAGTKYRGEFEERLKRIVEEVQFDPSIILVIDEIHTLVGAGAAEGAVDAANILKPALARGKFRCIGATTIDEYSKYIERDPALERRFQPIEVKEPNVGTTIEILKGLRTKFESHHGLVYELAALEQAAILANKYIRDRFLPDKAIDVIDESAARVRLQNRKLPKQLETLVQDVSKLLKRKEKVLKAQKFSEAQEILNRELKLRMQLKIVRQSFKTDLFKGYIRPDLSTVIANDVANVISNWTGIPVNKISGSETERLLKLEEKLHERIIGQNQAVKAISNAIRRARVGLRNPNRPIASFIFAGPTGVGKTELTKAVADYMYTGKESMVRFDMSEFMEKHTVAKLIGSPPGYVGYSEGGQLTEAVRTKPYCVVLFDEVEKAHPDVFNLLLQILDDGRLSDSRGRPVDFTNALIVMTTNLGAKIIERQSGIRPKEEDDSPGLHLLINDHPFGDWEPPKEIEKDAEIIKRITKLVKEELKNFFRPEFLNRIDEIIVFSHLSKNDIWQISEIMIKELINRLRDKKLILSVTDPVRGLLVDQGHDPLYGARPLRRTIMHFLEDQLAERCLSMNLEPNTKLVVRRKTLEDIKKEMKDRNDVDELRRILLSAYIILTSKSSDEKLFMSQLHRPEYTSPFAGIKHEVNGFENIDLEFPNPYGRSDDEIFTEQIAIDINPITWKKIKPKIDTTPQSIKDAKKAKAASKAKLSPENIKKLKETIKNSQFQ